MAVGAGVDMRGVWTVHWVEILAMFTRFRSGGRGRRGPGMQREGESLGVAGRMDVHAASGGAWWPSRALGACWEQPCCGNSPQGFVR
jgi:hypothetical protein